MPHYSFKILEVFSYFLAVSNVRNYYKFKEKPNNNTNNDKKSNLKDKVNKFQNQFMIKLLHFLDCKHLMRYKSC